MKLSRRKALTTMALGSIGMANPVKALEKTTGPPATFHFCLNTSTISGQNSGLKEYIDIATAAGYEGIEVWERDVKEWLDSGNSAAALKRIYY